MKNFYVVFAVDYKGMFEDQNKRYFADILKVSSSQNIAASLDAIGGLMHANICESKKQAQEIKESWNAQYKANGTYIC